MHKVVLVKGSPKCPRHNWALIPEKDDMAQKADDRHKVCPKCKHLKFPGERGYNGPEKRKK